MIYLYAVIFASYDVSNLKINCSDIEEIRTEVMIDEEISLEDKYNILNVLESKKETLSQSKEFCSYKTHSSI